MRKTIVIFLVLVLFSCKSKNNGENYSDYVKVDSTVAKEKKATWKKVKRVDNDCEPSVGGDYYVLTSHRSMIDYGEDFLIFMPNSELRFIRNSIFATKGYKFKSQDLMEYFSNESWYCAKYDNVDSLITETERENISFINQLEKTNNIDTLNKFDYFLKLFEKKYTSIPMYFQKYYFGNKQFDNCCFADKLVKQNKNFATIIYFTYPCPPPGHVEANVVICTVDSNGNIIDNEYIGESYEILDKSKIKYTKIELHETADESFRLDTIDVYYYEIDEKGIITEISK